MGRGIYTQSMAEACVCTPESNLQEAQVSYLAWFLMTYSASSLSPKLAVQMPDDSWVFYSVALRDNLQVKSPIQYGVVGENDVVTLAVDWLEEQSRESSEAERRRRQLDGEAWRRYGMRDEQFTPHGGTGGLWWRLTKSFPQHVIWHDGLISEHCVAKTDDDDVQA